MSDTPEHTAELELAAILGNGTATDDTATEAQGVVGQPLWRDGTFVGVLVQETVQGRTKLFIRNPNQPGVLSPFQPGVYMLSDRTQLQIAADGSFILAAEASSSGGGGTNQAALSAQGFQQDLAFLREQERLLRERNQIDAAQALADRLAVIEQQHQNALERDDVAATRALEEQLRILAEQQGFTTSEREAAQEFTGEQNELSRENAIRLQALQEISGLTREMLSIQARARELKATTLGRDPFKSAALAQGLTPTFGTPADRFQAELTNTIQQPIPRPSSMDIADIQATITELAESAGAGVPSAEGFGLPGLRAGGVIDMNRDRDGVFSPTIRRDDDGAFPPTIRRMAHGGTMRRPGRARHRQGAGEELQVLVGEAGPELMTVSEDEIRISPVLPAEHGLSISRPAFGGRRIQSLRGRDSPTITPPRPGPTIPPIVTTPPTRPPGIAPTPVGPAPPLPVPVRPGPGTDPTITGGGQQPGIDFEPSPTEITQALASIFAHLGFDQIPTFREGPRGGMQVPFGTLGSDTFERLGVAQPSLIRVLAANETASGFTGARNFWLNPATGRYELISEFSPTGTNAFDDQIQSDIARLQIEAAGFDPANFITEQLPTPGAGFGLPDLFGPDVPAFSGQDILRDVSPTAFPLRRNPISFRPTDAEGNFTDDQGFFLPSPRTVASVYRRSTPAVQAALLSAWETAFFGEADVLNEINFFTPQGSFNPAQVARFG